MSALHSSDSVAPFPAFILTVVWGIPAAVILSVAYFLNWGR